MKRIFPLFLCLLMLLPLSSCSTSTLSNLTVAETVESKTEDAELGPITIPEGFTVGYGRSPICDLDLLPILTFDGNIGKTIKAMPYLTSVAVSDGETVILILSIDIINITPFLRSTVASAIEKQYGIPSENVILHCTHNHAGPGAQYTDNSSITRWYSSLTSTFIPTAVEASLRDLSAAEMYQGTADTTGLNFVRRYLMKDGSWESIPNLANAVEHESVADPEMRVVKFECEGEKPIVLVNWQCHPANSYGEGNVNTDYIHNFRQLSEKNYNIRFVFYQGAAGDVVHSSRLPSDTVVAVGYSNVGKSLAPVLGQALDNMSPIETGKIRIAHSEFEQPLHVLSERDIEYTNKYSDAPTSEEKAQVMEEAGFASRWEINRNDKLLIYMSQGKTTLAMPHTAIAIGDNFAIATAGYEMFHQNAQDVRAASPFDFTFTLGYTDDGLGYIPTDIAFSHGSYEVYSCIFKRGTAENCANEMIRLLNEVKNK